MKRSLSGVLGGTESLVGGEEHRTIQNEVNPFHASESLPGEDGPHFLGQARPGVCHTGTPWRQGISEVQTDDGSVPLRPCGQMPRLPNQGARLLLLAI